MKEFGASYLFLMVTEIYFHLLQVILWPQPGNLIVIIRVWKAMWNLDFVRVTQFNLERSREVANGLKWTEASNESEWSWQKGLSTQ